MADLGVKLALFLPNFVNRQLFADGICISRKTPVSYGKNEPAGGVS